MKDEFESFCREMYQENCKERDTYGECLYSYEDYVEKNMQFLLDKFSEL